MNVLQLILQKESWEEILYHLVSIEGLDPWDVDLVKLADSFIAFLKQAIQLDFRIPAKVLFIAALLLRLKAERLSLVQERAKGAKPEVKIELPTVSLEPPLARLPRRAVTLEELIVALRKAMRVKERRERRRLREVSMAGFEIQVGIAKRIEELLKRIDALLYEFKTQRIEFSQLVGEWNRQNVVECLVPLLHLEQRGEVQTEQAELFGEIWISRKFLTTNNQA